MVRRRQIAGGGDGAVRQARQRERGGSAGKPARLAV
jgi:hypothetical protein